MSVRTLCNSVSLPRRKGEILHIVTKTVSHAAETTGLKRSADPVRPVVGASKRKVELDLQQRAREEASAKDSDAIERALSGDISGFKELVERYEKRVYNVSLAVLGNPEDAKDVTQEAFLRVYQRLESFRGESSFYTWLYRVAFNLSVDLSRKRYRSRELGFAEREQGSPLDSGVRLETVSESSFSGSLVSPNQAYERSELSARLKQALAELSDEHRAVISMRELEGLSYTEIAEAVGISKGTVMSRLHHARKKLQQLLKEIRPTSSERESKDEDLTEFAGGIEQ
jgi:RNA polymerase sigma-70 factor (ECF subfamily)